MSSRPFIALLGAGLVLACGPAPSSTVRCPDPAVAPAAPVEPAPRSEPAVAPAAAPTPAGLRPVAGFPISSVCQAPLAVTQEVTRMLATAAAHGTASAACVDGPGRRLAINDLLVCPAAPKGDQVVFEVFYAVATYPEGDTRACSNPDVDCSHFEPSATEHLIELRFDRKGGSKSTEGSLVDPGALPGFPADATALSEAHDGNCYGKSPAFTPAVIRVVR